MEYCVGRGDHPSFFIFSLSDHSPVLPVFQCLVTVLFMYFDFLAFLAKRINLVCYSIFSERNLNKFTLIFYALDAVKSFGGK